MITIFPSYKMETPLPVAITAFSLLRVAGHHLTTFCLYESDPLCTSCKRNHTAFDFLCLAYCTWHNIFKDHHVGVCVRISCLFKAQSYSIVCTNRVLFIRSTLVLPSFGDCESCSDQESQSGLVHPSMSMSVQVFTSLLSNNSERIPTCGIVVSYGNSAFNLRTCHIVFHSSWVILFSHQQCTGLQISLHPRQHCFPFLKSFIASILMGVKWYFTVILFALP